MRKRILNQPIDTFTMDEAVHLTRAALIGKRQFRIITLNPEMMVNAMEDFEFQAAINNSQLIVPDGIGIILASRFLNKNGSRNIERVPGIELAEKILEAANELGKKIAIFGGKKEVLEKLVSIFKEKYPNIEMTKTIDGYEPQEKHDEIAKEISLEKPDLVLVALGTPKQEIWINKHANLFPNSVMIGVGGSLDIWSGTKSRAPEWARKIYIEWLFRVITEPQRIPRVLKTLPQFIWLVFINKIKDLKNHISL